jgi:hypothetical protein
LPLGLESRDEVFDVEGIGPFGSDAARQINEKLPPGIRVLGVRELLSTEPALSRAVKSARYAIRLDSPDHLDRATEALANGWREAVPALIALAVERDGVGARMTFEVNLDQSAGETSTAKKVLETLLAIPPEAQASLAIVREATVLG